MNASFSIVTPNLNMGKFLQRSMASVIATLVPGDPYFIVDGGSSDNSLDDINSYRPQLTSVISEPDKGYADAIAKGFDQATGSLLCWVNSSDLPLPGALDAAREIFADPAVNLITGDVVTIDENDVVAGRSSGQFPELVKTMLYGGGTPWQVGCFWCRSAYEQVGRLRRHLRYAADFDIFLRLGLNGGVRSVPKIFGAHRLRDGQLSIAGQPRYKAERRQVQRDWIDRALPRVPYRYLTQIAYWTSMRIAARTRH